MPLVSIAMATYNGERFLREQLDSILAQTFTQWELIIADDDSSDATRAIIASYQALDSRIRLLNDHSHVGYQRNFERAIRSCSAEWIAFADQDDIWTPDHLELLFRQKGEASLSAAGSQIMTEDGQLTNRTVLTNQPARWSLCSSRVYQLQSPDDMLYTVLVYGGSFQGAAMLCHRDLLSKAFPIPDGVKYHDPFVLACSLVDKGYVFHFQPIVHWRQHSSNLSGKHDQWSAWRAIRQRLSRRQSQHTRQANHSFQSDRVAYCQALLERFPFMTVRQNAIINECLRYTTNRTNDTHRLWTAWFLIRHYKQIYATRSYRYLLLRVLNILLLG